MFDVGAFTSGLLTGLREGVEAALIVAIVCAYLVRIGGGRDLGKVAAGIAAAVAASVVLGVAIFGAIGELQAPFEQLFEAGAMLVAAAVVTWMLFWMRRQAASMRGDLQRAVQRALTEGSAWGLAVLAFAAVIREGVETALFLVGQAAAAVGGTAGSAGAPSVLAGAAAGIGLAAVLGVGFYRGSRALDLRRFFRWTGILLVFIAAGLLAHAVGELVEVGWIGVGTATAYDITAVLPHDAGVGLFLRALFGYSASPEWVTLATWAAYVSAVLWLYLRPGRARPAASRPDPAEAVAAPGA